MKDPDGIRQPPRHQLFNNHDHNFNYLKKEKQIPKQLNHHQIIKRKTYLATSFLSLN